MLEQLRKKIDKLDDEIAARYAERLKTVIEIGEEKRLFGIGVNDREREAEIVERLTCGTDAKTAEYIRELYSAIFETSRKIQAKDMSLSVFGEVERILTGVPPVFPKKFKTACQGVKGAFSYIAANKLFKDPDIAFFNGFEDVFRAVESGECEVGVLPIENNTAGSVNEIYDLMKKYKLYVVRGARVKVEHCLIAKKGAKLENIKEVYSNEHALAQCTGFIKANGLKAVFAENTAQSVLNVKATGRSDIAAVASKACASLYGMEILKSDIQDNQNNYTRFICVSKKLAVYEGANKVSIMVSLPHAQGSLLNFLKKFASYNMTKLESRPVPETGYEYMFYFDFEADLKNSGLIPLLRELTDSGYNIVFVGAYKEISDAPDRDELKDVY